MTGQQILHSKLCKMLQENEKPFGLMSEEMQAKAKEIGKNDNFECWQSKNVWHLMKKTNSDFVFRHTYRLCFEYIKKSEIIECKVEGYVFIWEHANGTEREINMSSAIDLSNFIGFKYKDSKAVKPFPRRYKDPENGYVYDSWKEGYEVLTPTHVLFSV